MARVKYMKVKEAQWRGVTNRPNFHKSGSITGMKKKYYGPQALLIRSGNYIYNVTDRPDLYDLAK